jgi:hypothetical protein
MITDTQTMSPRISELDYALEVGGIAADPVNLLLLAHTATELGVDDLLVSVMVDENEPEVARMRAYARVAVQVSNRMHKPSAARIERELQPAC